MLLRVTRDFRRAMDLSLVLDAEQIPHELRSLDQPEQWALLIDDADALRAEQVLRAFEGENPTQREPAVEEKGGVLPALLYAALVLAVQLGTGPRSDSGWFERGSADAERILHGEWWRTITALTLHADLGHALGNAAVGAVFLAVVARRVGPALATWILLVSGALGTLATALLMRSGYVSVGASTAVFGELGALCALRLRDPQRRREAWVYLAAGLALLGFLGTGKRADLAGHLCGFVAGLALGLLLARVRTPRPSLVQGALAAVVLLPVGFAWWAALHGSR